MENYNVRAVLLEDTKEMLEELDNNELDAIQKIISVIITKEDNYYKHNSENELFARIDTALEHIDAGLVKDAKIVCKDIIEEFGL